MKLSTKVLSFLLCFVFVFCTLTPMTAFANPEDDNTESTSESTTEPTSKIVKPKTTVSGIKYSFNSKADEAASMRITVSPASPSRKVKLQLYKTQEKIYTDIQTYSTANLPTATVNITIPKQYRQKTYGYWRIVVEESEKNAAYYSPLIKVVTTNVRSLKLSSKGACIYCVDDKTVLFDKNKDKRIKPMSCTKIMTLICVIESGKLNGTSPVTRAAIKVDAGKIHPKAGDRYRNKDLAHAMILASCNDAALMLANGTAGSLGAFTRRMNKTAKKVGLKNTHFTNSYGVPDKAHYTTAFDLCKLSAYGYNYDQYCEIVGRRTYGMKSIKYKKKYACITADKFIRNKKKGQIGGKTGFSEARGKGASYSGLYRYKGKVYAVTQMEARTKKIRWEDMKKLYKYVRQTAGKSDTY